MNDYFQSEITFSPFPVEVNDLLNKVKISEEQKKLIPENIVNYNLAPRLENFNINLVYDNKIDETYEEARTKMGEILIAETFKEIAIKMSEITEDEFRNTIVAPSKLKIKKNIYSWDSFYEECNELLNFHKEKCLECVKKFT